MLIAAAPDLAHDDQDHSEAAIERGLLVVQAPCTRKVAEHMRAQINARYGQQITYGKE